LEWAVRSYHSYVFGLALILFGGVIAVTGRVSRAIGYLMALSASVTSRRDGSSAAAVSHPRTRSPLSSESA
jgi:hypothetical protein